MGIWVKVGTRHESPSESGVSHFIEHMLFKGTEKRSALAIAKAVDQVGGEFNAFTTKEQTCFHITMLERDAALGVEILEDIMLNSIIDTEELERERKVILQEVLMVDENPEELVHDMLYEKIYGRHGLGRPILGTERSLRRLSRRDILNFYRKHYSPPQCIFSIAGNVNPQKIKKKLGGLVRRQWPGRPNRRGVLHFGFKPKFKNGFWSERRNTEQTHIAIGFDGPDQHSRDRIAVALLNTYLGGGMSSLLFQEIREKNGLAYTVYSSHSPYSDSGLFNIYCATSSAQVSTCLRLIRECLVKMRRDLLAKDDLEQLKENVKGTLLLSSDSMEARMSSIAQNEIFFHRYTSPDELCQQIDEITPEDIRRLARKLFFKKPPAILLLGPRASRSAEKRVKSQVADWF